MPHKPAAFELCDAVGPAATFEGVVNTIRIEAGGRLVGDSFDGGGFLNAAREAGVFDPERRCVVIGAGGAGRAICHALAAAGLKRIGILNETPAPVEALAAKLRGKFPKLEISVEDKFDDAGLLVNATSLGLHATDALPMDPSQAAGRLRSVRYHRRPPHRIHDGRCRARPESGRRRRHDQASASVANSVLEG